MRYLWFLAGTKAKDEEELELAVEKETNSVHFNHFMEKVTQVSIIYHTDCPPINNFKIVN